MNGWLQIIDDLSRKITELDPDVQASQVKEKFGGLRFYIDGGSDEVHKLIEEAEEESYKTCEKCGTKENVSVTKTGWIITLCDKCSKERNKEG
jgi:ribosomal protein L37AE/L43A